MTPLAWLTLILAAICWPLVALVRQDELDELDRHWDSVQDLFE